MRRQRIIRSQRDGGLSATTQVKVLSPEIFLIARGQGFHVLEASTVACVSGEHVGSVPGSKSVAGQPTVHIETWESRIAPDGSVQQAEVARAVSFTEEPDVGNPQVRFREGH